ncbi:MAG: hypothetical protein D6788_03770, partial [Planctomycetota bacterium]
MISTGLTAAAIAVLIPAQTANLTYVDTWTAGAAYPARVAPIPSGGGGGGGGVLYVTDPPNEAVVEYDATGAVVGTYVIPEGPVGIAVHDDGRVFVSRQDNQVGVYDATFTLLATVDPTPLAFEGPNDLAFDPGTGELYVVNSEAHQILVFSETAPGAWTLVRSWGMEGTGMGQLAMPQAIALDPLLGRVYVADTDNFRVQAFDTNGVFQFSFGYRILFTPDKEEAWFARGEGIAVDACGHVYLTDALMGTLRAFDSTGTELDSLHLPLVGFGAGPGALRLPADVAIDSGGNVYIANTNNG